MQNPGFVRVQKDEFDLNTAAETGYWPALTAAATGRP
jgi:hypothetical protein